MFLKQISYCKEPLTLFSFFQPFSYLFKTTHTHTHTHNIRMIKVIQRLQHHLLYLVKNIRTLQKKTCTHL